MQQGPSSQGSRPGTWKRPVCVHVRWPRRHRPALCWVRLLASHLEHIRSWLSLLQPGARRCCLPEAAPSKSGPEQSRQERLISEHAEGRGRLAHSFPDAASHLHPSSLCTWHSGFPPDFFKLFLLTYFHLNCKADTREILICWFTP